MKTVLKIMATLLVVMMLMMMGKFINDRQDDYDVDKSMLNVPTYTESMIEFNQGNDFTQSIPFMASAVIDIDGDGTEELFLGGSINTTDGLFKYKNGALVAIKNAAGITKGSVASYGSVVLDVNRDGAQDLLVAREDGVWLHTNLGCKFNGVKLDAIMP